VMRRVYGSDDLFPDDLAHCYRPSQSINYVTSHDGFTLYDLLSYTMKRNWVNGEENRDGADDNYSLNCGWEGDEEVPAAVVAGRRQRARLLACLLLLSNGTPMIRAGDEFLHTQRGNNNPYNQNNETSWLDWSRLEEFRDIHRFFQRMIAFRRSHPGIGRSRFWREDVEWYGAQGGQVAVHEPVLAYRLLGGSLADVDLYVMINASPAEVEFVLPGEPRGNWRRAIDTARESPEDIVETGEEVPVEGPAYTVSPHSVVVLLAGS
jgi:isoamylase